MDKNLVLKSIGIIRSSHTKASETPIQPVFARGIKGTVILDPDYAQGLQDLDKFSHIYLLYYFHRAGAAELTVKPFLENKTHGIFATRAPARPNPVGFSVVRLVSMEKNILRISDVDILDGTPLLDIKPYIKRFDSRENVHSGWQDNINDRDAKIRGLREFKQNPDRQ